MMNDEKPRRANPVSFSQFGDFLDAKNIAQDCSKCGHGNFAINTVADEEVGMIGIPVAKIDSEGLLDTNSPLSLATLSISCDNCGYTQFFSLMAFQRWLKEHQHGVKKDE